MQGEISCFPFIFQRAIPEGQGIEVANQPRAMMVWGLQISVAQGRKAEALQRLDIELQGDRRGLRQETTRNRPVQVGSIGEAIVALTGSQFAAPETAVLDVARQLVLVWLALALRSEEHTSELQS